jgi:hypothetical protein
MPRIVPQVVARIIEMAYPWAAETLAGRSAHEGTLSPDQAPTVAMILALAEQIPAELLSPDASDHATFIAACGAMRGALMNWSGGGHPGHAAKLYPNAAFGNRSPIVALLDVLRRSPDEAPSRAAAGLEFIPDPHAREDIRVDVSNAHRALGNGEYKAATVLAGSVIEALLLWAIKQSDSQEIEDAIARLDAKAPDKRGPEFWYLGDYIRVARALGVIDDSAATAASLAGEFRNLIHPGRVLRSGSRCDQATALTALGAMQRIIGLLPSAT